MSDRPHEHFGKLITPEDRLQAADEARMEELNERTKVRHCHNCHTRLADVTRRGRRNRILCSNCDPKGVGT